jgi:hypothetical protein
MALPFGYDASYIGAFGELVAHSQTPIISLSFPYNINAAYVTSTTANGGTVTQANSQAVLQTSAASNGSAQVESIFAARYSPGQGQVVRFTAVYSTGRANSQQEVGAGDANDGFFFGYQGASFGVFKRRNSTDLFIPQTAWIGDGLAFDPTKGNVYQIRYQWLGYGVIKFYVEDPQNGILRLAHAIQYPNANIIPSIFNPSLPLHAKVVNSGNTTNLTLSSGSLAIYSEGPRDESGARFSVGNRKTGVTTEANIFTLQNKATFQGIPNRARIHLDSIGSAISGGADAQYRMVLNATLGGSPSFTDISTNTSVAAFDVAGTTVTSGTEWRRGPSTGNFQLSEDINALQMRLNPGDTMTFAAQSFAAAVAPNLSISWREEL